jgi:hypothetical protein
MSREGKHGEAANGGGLKYGRNCPREGISFQSNVYAMPGHLGAFLDQPLASPTSLGRCDSPDFER